MEKVDFAAIKKLAPDRRIKALKELQEKLNELIKERTKEVEDSKKEIEEAREFLDEAEEELAVLEQMKAQAPAIRKIEVEKLFERKKPEEREEGLETITAAAQRQFTEQERETYIRQGARMPATQIRERVYEISDAIRETGVMTSYQQERLEQFNEMLRLKRESEYKPGQKSELEMTAAERTIEYLTGKRQYSRN
jgi:hypothetical protein